MVVLILEFLKQFLYYIYFIVLQIQLKYKLQKQMKLQIIKSLLIINLQN